MHESQSGSQRNGESSDIERVIMESRRWKLQVEKQNRCPDCEMTECLVKNCVEMSPTPLAQHRHLRCSPVQKFLEGRDHILILGNRIASGLKWALESFQPWNGKSVSFWCQLQSFSDGCLKCWAEKRSACLWTLWGVSHHQLVMLTIGQGAGRQHFALISQLWSCPTFPRDRWGKHCSTALSGSKTTPQHTPVA